MTQENLRFKKLKSEAGPEIPLFNVRLDRMQHPASAEIFERMVLEAPDWVNVVAVTTDDMLVMVEQYRFGVEDLTTEPVGGLVDEGETPLDAGKRELLEETGFGGGRWRYLGYVQSNPAIQDNRCHHWLAEGVERLADPSPDAGEAIRVRLMSLEQIKLAIADGQLRHPLGLSALSRVYPLWDYPYVMPEGD